MSILIVWLSYRTRLLGSLSSAITFYILRYLIVTLIIQIHPEKLHIVVLKEPLNGDVDESSGTAFRFDRMKSKSMKTKLFDIVDDPSIHTIAFVDCDVIFGIEGCAVGKAIHNINLSYSCSPEWYFIEELLTY
jgi:hypothetical protein